MTPLSHPRADDPVRWSVLFFMFALLALALMCWRWGGTVEDSQAYFDTARYFRGEVGIDALRAPFPYRTLVPAIAAALPGDLRQAFAALNWLLMTASACFMAAAVLRAGLDRQRAIGAGALMLVSLPTFWYAPYLLVDPGSLCARSAFVLPLLVLWLGRLWILAFRGEVNEDPVLWVSTDKASLAIFALCAACAMVAA